MVRIESALLAGRHPFRERVAFLGVTPVFERLLHDCPRGEGMPSRRRCYLALGPAVLMKRAASLLWPATALPGYIERRFGAAGRTRRTS